MMPRKLRFFLPQVPIHIVHSRDPVFFETQKKEGSGLAACMLIAGIKGVS
jgi:hypothetical protein